jgi:hypothetical protein
MRDSAGRDKPSTFGFLAWWKTDPAELEQQLERYHTGGLFRTARGWSVLAVLLTILITAALGRTIGYTTADLVAEGVIWTTLAIFMWRGHRWAFVAAMLLWTIEKGAMMVMGTTAGRAPITQILWWVAYMHAFNLGFRVEQTRRRRTAEATAEADDELVFEAVE